ncbi:hypothetical protein U1Q18_027451 [Sarracenia purpurea var. burkii]
MAVQSSREIRTVVAMSVGFPSSIPIGCIAYIQDNALTSPFGSSGLEGQSKVTIWSSISSQRVVLIERMHPTASSSPSLFEE